jgi:SAM-dependent methyltransferase
MVDERPDEKDRKVPDWVRATFWGDHPDSLAPYVPSPLSIVREMLSIARAGPSDVVYDLGCGDGRVLFTAVKEFNVSRAVGYDLDQEMVDLVEKKVREEGLINRISAIQANFMEADMGEATIVTLYLTTSGNAKLRPKLEADLKPGARIISHDFPVQSWVTDLPDNAPHIMGSHKMYLYRIPDAYRKKALLPKEDNEDRWRRVRDMFTRID